MGEVSLGTDLEWGENEQDQRIPPSTQREGLLCRGGSCGCVITNILVGQNAASMRLLLSHNMHALTAINDHSGGVGAKLQLWYLQPPNLKMTKVPGKPDDVWRPGGCEGGTRLRSFVRKVCDLWLLLLLLLLLLFLLLLLLHLVFIAFSCVRATSHQRPLYENVGLRSTIITKYFEDDEEDEEEEEEEEEEDEEEDDDDDKDEISTYSLPC
ncbi:unnamed protein product [Schistocephalus solidus]|uniref:Uncharacterized protein n=1 Tax=Schistocephalus solidus TaxID=70667 RepID=A0A183SPQ5_SCHSO|nr:unnamed protein product [Schistocephalus solidus]